MRQITELSQDYRSVYSIITEDNNVFLLTLEFISQQNAWFIDIEYGNFRLKGVRLVVSPNLLHQWRNKLPFGILIASADNQDPFLLNDFVTGRISIFTLTKTEVEEQQEPGNFYGRRNEAQ